MRTLPTAVLLALLCPALAQAQAAQTPGATQGAAPPPAAPAPAPTAPAAPPEAFPQQSPAPEPAPAPQAPPAPAPYGYGYGYPPGYGYAPGPMDPGRAKALADLRTVDARIATLRAEQAKYSITGPIAMTAAGFGVASFFAAWAIIEWAIAEDIQHGDCGYYYDYDYDYDSWCDVDNDGRIDSEDREKAQTRARAFGVTSAVVGGVGIAGAVLLAKSLGKRRAYAPELHELNARRRGIMQQLRYGGGYSQNGLHLTISGHF